MSNRNSRSSIFVKAHYHPLLFALITFSAMAELGLTAFLISVGNSADTWPSSRYHSLLILFLFDAIWTTVFAAAYVLWIVDGAVHLLASIASSIIWLLITSILWGTAAGIIHNTRKGGNCTGTPPVAHCRESLTVEALGWTEFSLCLVTLLATLIWVRGSRKNYRSSYYV